MTTGSMAIVAARTKIQLFADRRSRDQRRAVGNDLRRAREDQGISLRRLAAAAGFDPRYLTRIEAGTANASLEILQRVAACLGGDLGARYFPGTGSPLRDRHQAPIVETLLLVLDGSWARSVEVVVNRPARGVIDVVLARPDRGEVIAVEVHSQIRRLEQLIRWTSLKRESLPSSQLWQVLGGPPVVASSCLILRATSANRSIVIEYEQTLAAGFPAATTDAMASIRDGQPWPGATLLWADVEHGAATLRATPPRGVRVGRSAADRESSNTG